MLTLCEELLLIFIDDATGVIAPLDAVQCGLAGAILSDLALGGKIRTEDKHLILADTALVGDETLDEALALIADEKKARKVKYWIGALGEKKLAKRIANRLVVKNVLRCVEKRYLWVIPYEAYPQQDASAKYWVKQHLRAVVLGGEKADAHTVALLSLLQAARLLNIVFTKGERKAAETKVEELVKGDAFAEAVAQTLDDIDSAALAAVMAATAS
jgi:Golgi phosphoprotein 3